LELCMGFILKISFFYLFIANGYGLFPSCAKKCFAKELVVQISLLTKNTRYTC